MNRYDNGIRFEDKVRGELVDAVKAWRGSRKRVSRPNALVCEWTAVSAHVRELWYNMHSSIDHIRRR